MADARQHPEVRMNRFGLSGALCAILLVAACGGSQQRAESQVEPTATTGGMMGSCGHGMMMSDTQCPMMVPSVRVEEADIERGASVTFTTTTRDRVDDLRSRVRRMAAMMEAHHGQSAPTGANGMRHGMHALPPSHVNVVDVADGAKIELQAIDTGDVDALRAHVREHSEMMRAGTCPMMMHESSTG
jgi:hypothetical protein